MRRMLCAIVLFSPLAMGGCRSEVGPTARGNASALRTVPNATLFASFPQFDGRIEALKIHRKDEDEVTATQRFYPDEWGRDLQTVVDFAVGKDHLYALARTGMGAVAASLYIVPRGTHGQSAVQTVSLGPNPQRLVWGKSDALLVVGHHALSESKPGQLTLIDVSQRKVNRSIVLAGACRSILTSGPHLYVVESDVRRLDADAVVVRSTLAKFVLADLSLVKRVELPAGSGEVAIGPTGLLYVAHESALGLHATDGVVSVILPDTLITIGRIRLGMKVRAMAANDTHLVIQTLGSAGDTWVTVLNHRHDILFEWEAEEPVRQGIFLSGRIAYFPRGQRRRLARIDLSKPERLEDLNIASWVTSREPVGLLRSRVTGAH